MQLLVGVTHGGPKCGVNATDEQNNGHRDSLYVDVIKYADWIYKKIGTANRKCFTKCSNRIHKPLTPFSHFYFI